MNQPKRSGHKCVGALASVTIAHACQLVSICPWHALALALSLALSPNLGKGFVIHKVEELVGR